MGPGVHPNGIAREEAVSGLSAGVPSARPARRAARHVGRFDLLLSQILETTGMLHGLGYVQGMLIALIWGAVIGCSPPTGTVAERIPNLPKPSLEGFSDAARRQVQTAHRKALADPGSADASGRLGAVLQAYDRYEIAEACYRRAQQLDPESFRWTYYLATVQAASGKTHDAVESFRKALELRPEDLPASLRLADLLSHAGEVERAGEILSRLVEMHQKSAGVHYRCVSTNPAVKR